MLLRRESEAAGFWGQRFVGAEPQAIPVQSTVVTTPRLTVMEAKTVLAKFWGTPCLCSADDLIMHYLPAVFTLYCLPS